MLKKFNFSKIGIRYFSTNLGNLNMNSLNETKPKLKIAAPESKLLPYYDVPYITLKKSKFDKSEKEKTITIKTKTFGYSAYKLNDVCRLIRKTSINHALNLVQSLNSKGAHKVKDTLNKFVQTLDKEKKTREENGVTREIDNHYHEWRVAEAYVGKKKGMRIPHQRAKGQMAFITKQKTRLNLVLKRVDGIEAYEKIILGKSDPTFAYVVRQHLFMKNATLTELRNYSFITTSKGRFYRRIQFKRLVTYLREKLHKKYNKLLSKEVIYNYLKKELAFTYDINNPRSQYNNIARFSNMNPSDKLKVISDQAGTESSTNLVDKDYKEREESYNKKVRKL